MSKKTRKIVETYPFLGFKLNEKFQEGDIVKLIRQEKPESMLVIAATGFDKETAVLVKREKDNQICIEAFDYDSQHNSLGKTIEKRYLGNTHVDYTYYDAQLGKAGL